jgi:hypothetical protein
MKKRRRVGHTKYLSKMKQCEKETWLGVNFLIEDLVRKIMGKCYEYCAQSKENNF